jgi:hypothetical protein
MKFSVVVAGIVAVVMNISGSSCWASEPGKKAVEELQRDCIQGISSERAEKLKQGLIKHGAASFDPLLMYAIGDAPPECRGLAVFALMELAKNDSESVGKFILVLRSLASDEDLRETFEIACSSFGKLANDGLIVLLEAEDVKERTLAAECLIDTNADSLKARPDLKKFDPKANPEERKQFAKSWRDWWQSTRE